MRAAKRTQTCRVLQYHSGHLSFDGATALQGEIARYVGGIRGPRTKPVTEKQIAEWFAGTDASFVGQQLCALVASGKVRVSAAKLGSFRRFNGQYVYEIA